MTIFSRSSSIVQLPRMAAKSLALNPGCAAASHGFSGGIDCQVCNVPLASTRQVGKDRTTIVTGEKGALVAETVMGDLTFYENGTEPIGWDQIKNFRGVSEGTVTRYALQKREPLAVEHEHFRDAILGKDSEHVSMCEALDTMKVIQGMLDSAESGKTSTF